MRSFTAMIALLLVALPTLAQEADENYVLNAGDAEGFFGETAQVLFFLGTEETADDVNGFQFSVCHDEALSIGEEDVIRGESILDTEFDSFVIEVYETGWTVAAVLPTDETLGGELEIMAATYSIDDDVELACVEFCELEGVDPLVTVGDEEILPITDEGCIEVLYEDGGGGEESEYIFIAGDAEGFFEETAVVPFHLIQDGTEVNGYEFFACHDEALSLIDEPVVQGDGLDGVEFEFETITIEEDHWSVAALLSGDGVLEGVEVHLYDVTYEIVDDVEIAFIEFCESHTVTVGDDEIEAATENGSVEVLFEDGGGGNEEDEDLVLFADEAVGVVEGQATISVWFDNTSEMSVAGWQFALCHGENVDVEGDDSIEFGAATVEFEFTFHAVNVDTGYWNVGAVLDAEGEDLLEPTEEAQELYQATYELVEIGEAVLEFCGEGLVPEEIVMVVGEDDIYPVTEDGFIEIVEESGFRRGDVNGNGQTFPLLDAIDLFEYAFGDGEVPPCLDAADVDDNGAVFGLVDGIFLLNWAFNGTDEPPSPGPSECGGDPTDDDTTCLEPAGCE